MLERRVPAARAAKVPGDPTAMLASDLPAVPVFGPPERPLDEVCRLLASGRFAFLNEERKLGPPPVDWLLGPRQEGRLWAITLHYHRWLERLASCIEDGGRDAKDAEAIFGAYLGDWLVQCTLDRPGARDLAWNSYAIATRLESWSRAHRRLRGLGWVERNQDLHRRWMASYWQQADYLARHLEWDLRANHLLRDAIGLLWAGRFFDHDEARGWLRHGTELVLAQADEQVLRDGGHFERSPMYHLHVLEDLVTASHLVRDAEARKQLVTVCARMAEFSAWMRHADGEIPLLNDAALHAASPPGDAIEIVRGMGAELDGSPRRGTRYFEETGVVVHHGDRWSVFFDVGPVGAECQPGHGHADSFTVSVAIDGQRLVVDPGTYAYDDDARRRYDRSTSSHNTVCVDGEDSSEVWHIFRVGRKAHVHGVRVSTEGEETVARAWHDGFAHLPGAPRHERALRVQSDRVLVVDRIEGAGAHEVTGGFLIAPGWEIEREADAWRLRCRGASVRLRMAGDSRLRQRVSEALYHPEYGKEVRTYRIGWTVQGALPCTVESSFEVDA